MLNEQVTFYRDSSDTFRCEVSIKGSSVNESRVRLVLEFDNGKTYLFKGNVDSDGICEIQVPKLKEDDGVAGTATLEVIAENAFFEPWQGNFIISSRKSVKVESVQISTDKTKVIVTNVGGSSPKSKDSKLIESILKGYKSNSKSTKKLLSDYEPTKRVKDWARTVFENVNTPKALYTMMIIEARLKRLKNKK